MAKHCKLFDHTADVGLEGWGDSLAELFEALAEQLADLICPRKQVAAEQTWEVAVKAEDVEALAVDFLTEVMVTMQADRFVLCSVHVREITPNSVLAELEGECYRPDRHEMGTEVKAVTYHQLRIAREDHRWAGRVILDV
jgi:SHS2 domain-containing protein